MGKTQIKTLYKTIKKIFEITELGGVPVRVKDVYLSHNRAYVILVIDLE